MSGYVCKHLSITGLCEQCIREQLALIEDECGTCDGDGSVLNQYEPVPGIDHEMGVSKRIEERCRTCRGTGRVQP